MKPQTCLATGKSVAKKLLKSHSKTKGIQLRSFVIDKQFVQIVVKEQVHIIEAKLRPHAVSEIVEVKIIVISWLR